MMDAHHFAPTTCTCTPSGVATPQRWRHIPYRVSHPRSRSLTLISVQQVPRPALASGRPGSANRELRRIPTCAHVSGPSAGIPSPRIGPFDVGRFRLALRACQARDRVPIMRRRRRLAPIHLGPEALQLRPSSKLWRAHEGGLCSSATAGRLTTSECCPTGRLPTVAGEPL